ncbi:MAG: acyltransferase [Bdellovibrionales bacterium]|nr:acyltransferase [Bdellovibrionales bacterium]
MLSLLTAARFFAAFGVFCFHFVPRWIPSFDERAPLLLVHFTRTGYVFVPFFFLLSGFVLEHTYFRQKELCWREFLVKRFARLAPAFWLSLVLGLVPAWMALERSGAGGKLPAYLMIHLSFLGSWFPEAGVLNYPAWSIHSEVFFYLLFPFFLRWGAGYSAARNLLQLFALLLVGWAVQGLGAWWEPGVFAWNGLNQGKPGYSSWVMDFLQIHPVVHLPEFLMGICLSRLRRLWIQPPVRSALAMMAIALMATAGAILHAERIPYLWLNSVFLVPAFAAVILGLAILPWQAPAWLMLLGEASYSLYILHVPLRDWASAVKGRFLTGADPIVFTLTVMLAVLVLSVASYRWVEVPGRKFLLRMRP